MEEAETCLSTMHRHDGGSLFRRRKSGGIGKGLPRIMCVNCEEYVDRLVSFNQCAQQQAPPPPLRLVWRLGPSPTVDSLEATCQELGYSEQTMILS